MSQIRDIDFDWSFISISFLLLGRGILFRCVWISSRYGYVVCILCSLLICFTNRLWESIYTKQHTEYSNLLFDRRGGRVWFYWILNGVDSSNNAFCCAFGVGYAEQMAFVENNKEIEFEFEHGEKV